MNPKQYRASFKVYRVGEVLMWRCRLFQVRSNYCKGPICFMCQSRVPKASDWQTSMIGWCIVISIMSASISSALKASCETVDQASTVKVFFFVKCHCRFAHICGIKTDIAPYAHHTLLLLFLHLANKEVFLSPAFGVRTKRKARTRAGNWSEQFVTQET